MKKYLIPILILGFVFSLSFIQCENTVSSLEKQQEQLDALNKKGPGTGGDDDSDRPPWAGGNTDENPHQNPNPDSGTKRGDDYGDLYVCLRDDDGVPDYEMITTEEHGDIWVVQPIAFLSTGEVNEYGDPILVLDGDGFPVPAYPEGSPDYVFTWVEGELYHSNPAELLIAPATVEMGRKNLTRAPQKVLDNAFNEAMKALEAAETLDIDFCGRLVGSVDGLPKTIDSPRENMALYQQLMLYFRDGTIGKLAPIELKLDDLCELRGLTWMDLAAGCFAGAGDKGDNFTVDEIMYANTFLKINLKDADDKISQFVNFEDCLYNRERYQNRCIRVMIITGPNTHDLVDLTIADAGVLNYFSYTQKWGSGPWVNNIQAFRTAADDALQVLEYIHGDSNIEFLGHNACN